MGFLLYHYLMILPSWLPPPDETGSTTVDVVSTTEVVSTTTESTTVESTTASEDVDEPPQDARAKIERIKTSFFINCFFLFILFLLEYKYNKTFGFSQTLVVRFFLLEKKVHRYLYI
jgi:hypothetical protein